MGHSRNFNPEWGYLAPAPSFLRTVRMTVIAAAIGAIAGAAVVFSLVERPAADESVAARTLAQPVQSASLPIAAAVTPQPQRPAPSSMPQTAGTGEPQSAALAPANTRAGGFAAAESSANTTTQHASSAAALAEVPAAIDAAPVFDEPAAAPDAAQAQKKAIKKPVSGRNAGWRNASRGEQTDRGPLMLLHSLSERTTASGYWPRGAY